MNGCQVYPHLKEKPCKVCRRNRDDGSCALTLEERQKQIRYSKKEGWLFFFFTVLFAFVCAIVMFSLNPILGVLFVIVCIAIITNGYSNAERGPYFPDIDENGGDK